MLCIKGRLSLKKFFPFFGHGENANPYVGHRPGEREGQQVLADGGVIEKDQVHGAKLREKLVVGRSGSSRAIKLNSQQPPILTDGYTLIILWFKFYNSFFF